MSRRPSASLGRILDDLGATLLERVLGEADVDDVSGVAIYDPHDEPVLSPRTIVLGVGVHRAEDVTALLRRFGDVGAAALVVRAPVEIDDAVRQAVRSSGVTLFGLTRGASWVQATALLRSMLAEDDIGDGPDTLAGAPAGDLFTLANAIAALLDAPVTIEDRNSRVLAFSGRQDEADQPRIDTILGQQVPERYTRMLKERGVFRALNQGSEPVYIEKLAPGVMPRVAIAVRAGDEMLGSMWAVVHKPLSPEREQTLAETAKVVALHILRQRAGADVERRIRADLVATMLEGGPRARDAAARLRIAGPAVVLAFDLLERNAGIPNARLEAERQWASDAFALHLSAVHSRSATALIGSVAYGVLAVPTGHDEADERAVRVAEEFLDRTGDRVHGIIGIGRVADDLEGLAFSRSDADRALRVLRTRPSRRRVARVADVHVDALLLELIDLDGDDHYVPVGPLTRLLEYDKKHHGQLVPTLGAWLDAFGDVNQAAAAVHVHPNTFRYRLRRVAEISGLDIADPEARFAAMLQLRLLFWR